MSSIGKPEVEINVVPASEPIPQKVPPMPLPTPSVRESEEANV